MNRDALITALEEKIPNHTFRPSEDFDGTEGAVWTSGEDEATFKGREVFDYYSQDGGSKQYTFGVLNSIHRFLEKHGWYCEWYDPGTVMIFES